MNVGIIGYRFIGTAHANALRQVPRFFPDAPEYNLEVLIGRDAEDLTEAADQLGFDSISTDWESALDDIDVLYNLGPNHVHVEPSIAALERDIHTFCEKPLAPTLDEAERMAAAAVESDAHAACGFNYRFAPAVQYAKQVIDRGEIGSIREVRGRYLQDWLSDPDAPWSWRTDESRAGTGALADQGSHVIDLIRFLCKEDAGAIESVSGTLERFIEERPTEEGEYREVTVDDAASALLSFESGATGTIQTSRVASGKKNDHGITIYGSKGNVSFSAERINELEVTTDRGSETILVTDEEDPYGTQWWPPGHVLGWEHTFIHESYEFLSAVASGDYHQPSFEDGLEVQRVIDAIKRSSDDGERKSVETGSA